MDETRTPAETPTVAVCIGTYNQAQYLEGAIESALSQTFPVDEIWVVHDCSTDDTPAVMEAIRKQHPQIFYHRHAENIGPARNLSFALAQPKTEYVVRLDSDDRLEPGYVEELVRLMSQYPRAGYAHCNVWEIDGAGQRARHRQLNRSSTFESSEQALRSNHNGLRTAANCLLFRSEALRQANFYLDHPTWTASEDWYLAVQMALKGWGNVYSQQTLSNYRQWDDPGGIRASRKVMEVQTNTIIFRDVLLPAYEQRGWDTAILRRNMKRKARGFADALDSPRFSEEDRVNYTRILRELGDGYGLSLAIFASKMGLTPIIRRYARMRTALKDRIKRLIRAARG